MKTIKLLIFTGVLVFLLSGCGVREKVNSYVVTFTSSNFWSAITAIRTSPGQTRQITKKINFYFAVGDDKYREISEDLYNLLISDVRWFASDGVTLRDPTITANAATIVWEEGDTTYKVPGVSITIIVEASFDDSISVGKKGIYIEFPNVKLIASAMGVQPKTGINPLEERILVSQVNVHSSEIVSLAIVYVPIGLGVIAALYFGWNWLKYRL